MPVMGKLRAGDRVSCRVKDNAIVGAYEKYDELIVFEIVAEDEYGYYIYVPHYITIKNTSCADTYQCRMLSIDPVFCGEQIVYIRDSQISRIAHIMDGMKCKRCREFFAMASPNQEDGSMLCYSCRFNPYR